MGVKSRNFLLATRWFTWICTYHLRVVLLFLDGLQDLCGSPAIRNALTPDHRLTYFKYPPDEPIESVYRRLCLVIDADDVDYTHLIGFSMGGVC